jgi:biotin carboxylase
MEKIVIIGANNFQNPLILKAKEMGYETHVFAWQDGSIGEKTADYFYPISIIEKEAILEVCKKIDPKAVVTIASDLAAITAAYIASELSLPCNTSDCIKKSTNKFQMRHAMEAAGVSVPKYQVADESDYKEKIRGMSFPIVIKPTDRSGSRSITKVSTVEEAGQAVSLAVGDSFENKAIIEEYIDGDEYSMEAISFEGKHFFLALTQKFTTGSPHYIETAHLQPAGFTKDEEQDIKKQIFHALDALGIMNGASHSEFRINSKGELKIIEIGARMGGDCIGSHLVPISTGEDFLRMVVEAGMGKRPVFRNMDRRKIAYISFIMNQEDLEKFQRIEAEHAENLREVSEIAPLNHQVIDSSSRFGYYIIECEDYEEFRRIVKNEA